MKVILDHVSDGRSLEGTIETIVVNPIICETFSNDRTVSSTRPVGEVGD